MQIHQSPAMQGAREAALDAHVTDVVSSWVWKRKPSLGEVMKREGIQGPSKNPASLRYKEDSIFLLVSRAFAHAAAITVFLTQLLCKCHL